MELISVLMPTYNVEKYIEEAVYSILNQTWTNFELIIVDDCSTDGTYEKLLLLASQDDRIKLFHNDSNLKICRTLNRAWSYAKGEYIARMDGDDVSLPERFEVLMNYLKANPTCGLVGSGMITIDENGCELSRPNFIKTNGFIRYFNKFKSCVTHIWIARREVYEQLGGYRMIPYAEDYDFVLRCITCGFGVANVNAYIYKVRIRNGNTGSVNGLEQYKAKDYVLWLYKNECKSKSNYFDEEQYLNRIYCSSDEKIEFQKARDRLNIAILNKSKRCTLIKNTILAMLGSRYIAKYIFDSVWIRMGIVVERYFFKQ